MTSGHRDDNRMLHLVGEMYDAAVDESLWAGLAAKIAQRYGSDSCLIQVRAPAIGKVIRLSQTENYTLVDAEDYCRYYWKLDCWAVGLEKIGLPHVIESREVISDRELSRSEYYNDWMRRIGMFYVVSAGLRVSDDETGYLGIHRSYKHGHYTEADKRKLRALLRHLQRALQIRRGLAQVAIGPGAALDILDRLGTATMIAGGDGRVLCANRRAEDLLRDGDGLRVSGGRVTTVMPTASAPLAMLIQGAAETAAGRGQASGGTVAIARADRLPLSILVAPMRAAQGGFGAPEPAAILFIRDSERPSLATCALQQLFDLTATEAAIARELCEGKSNHEISALLGVSSNTTHAHLRAIFAKTGARRRGDLVGLLPHEQPRPRMHLAPKI